MAKFEPETNVIRVALIGAETLLGRELQDVLEKSSKQMVITHYAANGEGNIGASEAEGEAVFLEPLNAETVSRHSAIVLAGTPEGSQKAYEFAKGMNGRITVIDCNGHLENKPEAQLVAPLVWPIEDDPFRPISWLQVLANPAATALSLVLIRLGRYAGATRVVANIFEPASERGKAGVSELHQQTTGLLAFKPLDKNVFDSQLSFNLLARLGEEAPHKLSASEQRIENHISSLLTEKVSAGQVPLPSVRLVQAPVFHGYSISLWIEFGTNLGGDEIAQAIASAQIEVRGENEEPPNNVGVASQSGVIAGDIRADRNNGRASWLWLVCDNLRVTADGAAEVLAHIKAYV